MILSQLQVIKQSARSYLRAATCDLHSELDSRVAPLFIQGDAGYAQFLANSAKALWPLERALTDAGVSAILPDWPSRTRSDALRLDLSALGLPEPAAQQLAPIGGAAFQFGMLYVLEGSRLGAEVLQREASISLSRAARAATHYLAHGQGMRFWATFLDRLETSQHVQNDLPQAACGARMTFEVFLDASAGVAKGVAFPRG